MLISESYLHDLLTQVVTQEVDHHTQHPEQLEVESPHIQSGVSKKKRPRHRAKLIQENPMKNYNKTDDVAPKQATVAVPE